MIRRRLWVMGALVAMALSVAPHATADTNEDQYLEAILQTGYTVPNPAATIEWGYRICTDLVLGYDPWLIVRNSVTNGGDTSVMVARAQVAAASLWLCPTTFRRVAASGV